MKPIRTLSNHDMKLIVLGAFQIGFLVGVIIGIVIGGYFL